ncbi:hypothetical protein GCM10023115_46950 [Pontixanthobacter gangjinensis]
MSPTDGTTYKFGILGFSPYHKVRFLGLNTDRSEHQKKDKKKPVNIKSLHKNQCLPAKLIKN